ncbi:UDP-N-acetylmuramoyl-L-alanyl-D-glutamate--2,6-diaminopimelate ligase [uncultured Ilyobacter sp.]|uniref:UDP-N-acetylmuramoyl-L-alanyl-D-glutamate--2, 6-diaminopimelate ligase n=1 Tax=uncultured Ilyobacter sp. TaxID=544433 RepID=UPI0029F53B57|nr:UDP-N-acetylmuramoyl-L-alanyl-D-glutamate--2,6-diaminopimelate ligase [uncultured Ilyobacter sp.]
MVEILNGIDYKILKKFATGPFSGMEYDSRKVKKGDIFVALEGAAFDGHKFIDMVVKNGASAVIGSKEIEVNHDITYIVVKDLRQKLGVIASNFYKWPQKKLEIVGITGTNGKTTTTYLLEQILGEDKVSRIGTVEYKVGNEIIPAPNTTPESLDLIKICRKSVDRGIKYLIMEVSSHALEMGRVEMIEFDVAAFTNLTPEHLDYHKDMEEYFSAKRKLFSKTKKAGNTVFNVDDPHGKRLFDEFGGISYGIESGDLRAAMMSRTLKTQKIKLSFENFKRDLDIKLQGKFNIYNLLSAVGVAMRLGLSMEEIVDKLENLESAPGRFECIEAGQDFMVVVDYAHTADALENILTALNEIKIKKIITVFGCGGDRDPSKRKPMAETAEKLSDIVIVTSDNPRTEDPNKILEEVSSGLSSLKHSFLEIDREKAIEKAVGMAKKNDIVLIAGKGHEDYQIIGKEKIHFDDKEIALKYIKNKIKI